MKKVIDYVWVNRNLILNVKSNHPFKIVDVVYEWVNGYFWVIYIVMVFNVLMCPTLPFFKLSYFVFHFAYTVKLDNIDNFINIITDYWV